MRVKHIEEKQNKEPLLGTFAFITFKQHVTFAFQTNYLEGHRWILWEALLWIIRCHPSNYFERYYCPSNYFERYYHPSNYFERYYQPSKYFERYYLPYNYFERYYHPSNCTLLSIQVSSLHVMVSILGQSVVTLRRRLKYHINTKHHIMRSNVLKMYPQAGLPTLFAATALILRAQSCSNVTLESNASCRPLTLVVLPWLHTTTTTSTTTGLAAIEGGVTHCLMDRTVCTLA